MCLPQVWRAARAGGRQRVDFIAALRKGAFFRVLSLFVSWANGGRKKETPIREDITLGHALS